MDKSILSQINSIRLEIKDLKDKIEKINKNSVQIVKDSVKGSSTNYPYIKHNCIIEGIDDVKAIKNRKNKYKYKKLIKSEEYKLEKLINQLEYELKNVNDSDIRRIIRHKYEEDLSWVQIMYKMNYDSESKARMKLERFLKNL